MQVKMVEYVAEFIIIYISRWSKAWHICGAWKYFIEVSKMRVGVDK